jgi:tetratricopeptide (TPR) repeat protein
MEEHDQAASAEEHLRKAIELEEKKNFEASLVECDEAIEKTEAFLADIFNLRGIVLEGLERKEEAIAAYNTAVRLDRNLREAADNLFELEVELGKGRDLVTVETYSFPAQAHVARGRLEAEGIPAFVMDEGVVTAQWLYSNAVGGVKVRVREGDVERARRVLGGEYEEEANVGEVEPQCPSCGSTNVRYEQFAKRAVFGSQLLLGIPLPFVKRVWKCRECECEWRGQEKEAENVLEDDLQGNGEAAQRIHELADEHAEQGRWEEAIEAYKRGIALDPSNGDLYNNLAIAYEEAGRMGEAEQAYLESIERNPEESMAYYNLATMYEDQERIGEAIEAYRKCQQYSTDEEEQAEVRRKIDQLGAKAT